MRISRWGIGASLLLVLGASAGCSSTADIQQLNQNEFTLRGMIASDRSQIDAQETQIKQLQDQIAEMQHNSAGQPSGAALADVGKRLSKLDSEVAALQAAIPASPAASMPGAPAAGTMEGVPAEGESGVPSDETSSLPGGPPAEAGPAPVTAPVREPSPTWPQDLDRELADTQTAQQPGGKIYREGLLAMKSGNYPTAIIKFSEVEHRFPKSPLSAGAEYFQANALYENGKLEDSILQFNDLVMRFPSSPYSCASLLREGQAFMKLNDKIDARLTLQKLTANDSCGEQNTAANDMLRRLSAD